MRNSRVSRERPDLADLGLMDVSPPRSPPELPVSTLSSRRAPSAVRKCVCADAVALTGEARQSRFTVFKRGDS
jgi:hypothetical protein